MSTNDLITCPRCQADFELTEALSGRLREQISAELTRGVRAREEALAAKEKSLAAARAQIEHDEEALEAVVNTRVEQARAALAAKERARLEEEHAARTKAAAEELDTLRGKLETAQSRELDLMKEKRALAEATRELELEVAREIEKQTEAIRQRARREAFDEQELTGKEKDKTIGDLKAQIELLHRKADTKSQQLQGEAFELTIEGQLQSLFPNDEIAPVSTGVRGADLLHHVYEHGHPCGTILWETKQTMHFSPAWLPKLRDDQRSAQADVAALVTVALPDGMTTFDRIDDVWVTSRGCLAGLAASLRSAIVEVSRTKRSVEDRSEKMDLLYEYLTGAGFRRRAEGIAEAFGTMREDLDREKRAYRRIWARREKEIDRAITSAAGLWGDIEGLAGHTLPHTDVFALPEADDGEDDFDFDVAHRGAHDDDAGESDADVAERILDCLERASAPLARADILERTNIDVGVWNRMIQMLVFSEQVVRTGEKRGARYALATVSAASTA